MYENDNRVVLTLDAGGTNFVFSAIQANKSILDPFCLPAQTNDLNLCLSTLESGFSQLKRTIKEQGLEPVAISFAFPGPADYKNGIIGDLPNFPAFRGGVPLGPFLEEKFNIPVYINNDGNLFAYGEALAGVLPQLNKELKAKGSSKRYENLVGITFGTGFGSGIVINQRLLTGDNGCGGDVWAFRNKLYTDKIAEESVSIRAIVRVYKEFAGEIDKELTPKDIYEIAEEIQEGNKEAAIKSFEQFGNIAGDAIAHLQAFTDGIIVLGGGIIGAAKFIMPSLIQELEAQLSTFSGLSFGRLQMKVLDLTDEKQKEEFFTDKSTFVKVYNSNRKVRYNSTKQTAIVTTAIGTNQAVSLGAYAYALAELDRI